MLKAEQVPEVVWRVAMMTYHREIRRNPEQAWQRAIAAAVTTWPLMYTDDETVYGKVIGKTIFLPLPQEPTDAEA